MGTIILGIIIGLIVSGIWTFIIEYLSKDRNLILWGINIVLGALVAVAANQLVVYGPMILGISIVPSIVGALVLAMIATYTFKKIEK